MKLGLFQAKIKGYWYDIEIELPNIQCDRCVLQWIYHGGNNWGCDGNGNCGIGYGAQEEFINCADVRISGDAPATTSTTSTTSTTTSSTTTSTTTSSVPTTTTTSTTTTTTTRNGYPCVPPEEAFPYPYQLDTSSLTVNKYPTSCSEGGLEGKQGSVCFITCNEDFTIEWEDPNISPQKQRTSITCKGRGEWVAKAPFKCTNPCPKVTQLTQNLLVIVCIACSKIACISTSTKNDKKLYQFRLRN